MPYRFPYCTPASTRHTEPTVAGWGRLWNGTPPLSIPLLAPLPIPSSRRPRLLRVVFLPSFSLRFHLLRMLVPPFFILLSPLLLERLIRPQSFPPSFPLGPHFLGVVFPPLSFPIHYLLSVVLIPCSLLFSQFLRVRLILPSFLFSHLLSVVLPPLSFPFSPLLYIRGSPLLRLSFLLSHFLSVVLHPLLFLLSHFLSVVLLPLSFLLSHLLSIVLPPFSFILSHLLPVGFLPLPISLQLSAFRCLYPLRLHSSSIRTRPALDVTCHSLPPLKPLERHLTLITGQRRQYHTQVSNTHISNTFPLSLLGPQCLSILFPPTLLKLATLLRILVWHRDQRHMHPLTPSPSL